MDLKTSQGVLINRVNPGSAAEESGLRARDVIIGIDNHSVTSVSELQELVARNRPGAIIDVSYLRDGESVTAKVKLKNSSGTEQMEKREIRYELNGVEVADVQFKELAALQLEGGVRITRLSGGKWEASGMMENFIISHIDKVPVDNVEDLNQILEFKRGGILVEGYYPDGEKGVYGLEW